MSRGKSDASFYIRKTTEFRREAFKSKANTTVWRNSVLEGLKIELKFIRVEALFLDAFNEGVVVMDALSA